MNRLWIILLVIGLLGTPLARAEDEPIVLSGTYVSLTRAMQNLIHGMSKAEPDFGPEDVDVRFEVLDVGKLPLPANAVENYLDRTTPEDLFEEQKIRLEGMIGKRINVRVRTVQAVQIAALQKEFDRAADELWPFYQKVLGRAPPASETEPEFHSPWRVLWGSITDKGNLRKAVLRFSLNTTLVGFSLYKMEDMTVAQSAILATAGGSGSFLLMAGNDFYKSFLASPFWTKFPTPTHVKKIYLDEAKTGKSSRWRAMKNLGMGLVKDALVITGYVGVIMGVSAALGVGPETLSDTATTFLKTLGLSIWTETSFNLLNAGMTAKALEDLPADPAERAAKIKRVRGYSATAALIQSPIVTVLQIMASVGSVAGQTALLGLGAVGAMGYVTLVVMPPDSKLGKWRDKHLMPFLTDPIARIRNGVRAAKSKVGGAGRAIGTGFKACGAFFARLVGRRR